MSILQKTSNLDRAKDDAQRQSSKTARSGRNDPLARRGEEESSIGGSLLMTRPARTRTADWG